MSKCGGEQTAGEQQRSEELHVGRKGAVLLGRCPRAIRKVDLVLCELPAFDEGRGGHAIR